MKAKIITLCILFFSASTFAQPAYNIKVTVKPFHSGCYTLGIAWKNNIY
jgi:hypothetical protein